MASFHQNNASNHQQIPPPNPKPKQKQFPPNSHNNLFHPIKPSQNMPKKKDQKITSYQPIKKQQPPDPILNHPSPQQSSKLPQPQLILKQIQKNVNVLKSMYYASISQHTQQINNPHLIQKISVNNVQHNNHKLSNQYHCHQKQLLLQNYRKSADIINLNKKIFNDNNIYSNDFFNHHQNKSNKNKKIDDLNKGNKKYTKQTQNKDKKKKNTTKDSKKCSDNQFNKSKQNSQKNCLERRKSIANISKSYNLKPPRKSLHQQLKQKNPIQKQLKKQQLPIKINITKPTQPQKNPSSSQPTNIDSLFQIFKFYKKSIDETLSKNYQTTNMATTQKTHSNYPSTTSISNNQSTLHDKSQTKSQDKQTPNNSNTKHTTNQKNTSKNNINQIQPSIQVFQDDTFKQFITPHCYSIHKNNTTSHQKQFNKCKDFIGDKPVSIRRKSLRNLYDKQEPYYKFKNFGQQVTKGKQTIAAKKQQQKAKPTKKKGKSNEKSSKPIDKSRDKSTQKFFKKKSSFRQSQSTSHQPKHPQPIQNDEKIKHDLLNQNKKSYKYLQYPIDKLQFPQIQFSAFDHNMPILQQDSRQQASSSMIGAPQWQTQKQQHKSGFKIVSNSLKQTQQKINKIKNPQQSLNTYFQRNSQQPPQLHPKQKLQSYQSYNSKQIDPIHDIRFPTPSFVSSSNDQQISKYSKNYIENIENQSTPKSLIYKNNQQDDSLVGCQIPKRDGSNSKYLDRFQLVSFEL